MGMLKWLWLLICTASCECFVNLAYDQGLRGNAIMSEVPLFGWNASYAVDGDPGKHKPCTVMKAPKGYQHVWWKVWLERTFNIAELKIYFQPATIYRSTGFSIYVYDSESYIPPNGVSGSLVYQHDPNAGCPPSKLTIIVNKTTRGIAFYNTEQRVLISNCTSIYPDTNVVEICEVNVLGCNATQYSRNCSQFCDKRCRRQHCDAYNGKCIYGCSSPHFDGPYCSDCIEGYYGDNCTLKCGNCKDRHCNKTTGACLKGCLSHWNGSKCDVCADGYYGQNCSLVCGHCKDNLPCNQIGHCPGNCSNTGHWKYPMCQECEAGFHGEHCTQKCGQCVDIHDCNKTTGVCSSGCQKHWNGSKCDECKEGFYGPYCKVMCGLCKEGAPCDKKSGECIGGCQSSYSGDLCQSPLLVVEQNSTEYGAVAGGIAGGMFLFAVAVAILIFIRRRRLEQKPEACRNASSPVFERGKSRGKDMIYAEGTINTETNEDQEEMLNGYPDGGYYNIASVSSCIRIEDLQRIITEKNHKTNNIFGVEYKKLPIRNTKDCITAQKPENVSKNRFKSTFPYEHTRVVLEEKWNPSDNDYINASYIKDNEGDVRFIAAQGPRKNTVEDFWRMMWQENIKNVVMLTNLIENGKNKCCKYWPDKEQSMVIGPCTVSLSEEIVYSFYVVRKLRVQYKETVRKRTITQYHYTAWLDHGTPEEIGLIQFHRAVLKAHQRTSPLLVHCSAGVGRTGTFIALDALLDEGRKSGKVNVLGFVTSMREDRMSMVQTVEQYVFLHKALLEGLQGYGMAISEGDFLSRVEDMLGESSPLNEQQIYHEFKKLLALKSVYDVEEKDDAKTSVNLKKNFSVDILPVSRFRPYLTTYVKGRTDYINAVIVPSFTNPIGFIITQKPLADTEVDLWRMCIDHQTDGILILNDKDKENTWIPSRGSPRTVPPYTITARDTESTMGGVMQGVIGVSDKGGQLRSIDIFQLPVNDGESILKAVELILTKTKSSAYRTIVISRDGAGPAGIFCAVHNAVQELRMDAEIDLFTIVRQIHSRRPEVIDKLDDYKRCYGLLMTLMSAQGIYANL